MKRSNLFWLLLALAGCQSESRPAPSSTAGDTSTSGGADGAPADSGGGEIYLAYSGSSSNGTHGGQVFDSCYLVGPGESVALVETTGRPTFENYDSCGTPDDYRRSLVRIDARVRRLALGSVPEELTGVALEDMHPDADNPVYLIEPGSTELWSLRLAGDEWIVVRRIPVTVSDTPNATPDGGTNSDLPAKWSELQIVLAETQASYEECDERHLGVDEYRNMSAERFDTWVHSWVPSFGDETKCP